MENKTGGMYGCERCPTCNLVPEPKIETSAYDGHDLFALRCEAHGHVALGENLEQVVEHWNRYIRSVRHQAASHFIDNGPGALDESYCTVCGDSTKTEDFPDRAECARCHAVKNWKPEPKKRASGGMLALLLGLFLVSGAQAAVPADMQAYANNAILNAAEHGYKKVVLVFGHANPGDIEDLADDLRARGYRIDEEAQLLNPRIIKVQYLKASALAQAVR